MTIIYSILTILLFILVIYSSIFWSTHLSMSKQYRKESKSYGYAGYRKFKKEFDKVEWLLPREYTLNFLYDQKFPYSTSQVGASIFRFNDVQMVINNPISYFFVERYIKKYIKTLRNENTIKPTKIKW